VEQAEMAWQIQLLVQQQVNWMAEHIILPVVVVVLLSVVVPVPKLVQAEDLEAVEQVVPLRAIMATVLLEPLELKIQVVVAVAVFTITQAVLVVKV
jgi:hypothetical protein